ncbi:G-type lectin S-receptor-like serine/threonine-protein kinase At2g19130 [Magnolia sinica]|uniref:G-type lectin S-receptor-like serine/threonine-protein kinase At2g19130 n=1 Tax=Magnolia sinica TaxID=86752 RepID=UPI00265B69F0|nr:G-type lectin S-receptor-like serine/threonine-protein kinase At2g19130 [Magnolia sinica]
MVTTSRPFFFLPFFLIILFFTFKTHVSMAADTISLAQPLSGNLTITSKDGNFELGFFTPGLSQNYYIGIWFKKVSQQTVVWVANRETPLPDASSQLKISEQDGNLVLINHTKIPTWSCNSTSKTSNPTFAVLLDTGNLVLREVSNSSSVIWQSFDYPTDTWLPGNRIGLNKITGLRQRLISWRNSEDPAPGAFSLQIEEDGTNQYFMLHNNSDRYWSSGVWNGYYFSLIPEMTSSYIGQRSGLSGLINMSYVTNKNENYFTYSYKDASIIVKAAVSISGQFQSWVWSKDSEKWNLFTSFPGDQCDVYGLCGSYGVCNGSSSPFCTCLQGFHPLSKKDWELGDRSSGCLRETNLQCSDNRSIGGEKDIFLKMLNILFPVNPQFLAVRRAEECELACFNNCSCTSYAYNSSGCFIWNGDLLNLRQPSHTDVKGRDLYLRVAASRRTSKGVAAGVIVGSSIGMVAFFVIVLVIIWRCRRKLPNRASTEVTGSLVAFRYTDLRSATNDFAEKLGGGSFGSVFKGTLPDSSVVAVKKLEGLRQGEKQFRSEVSTIGMIQHVNLVRLHGFCSEGSKRLLVYDFMPNGSLDSLLFGKKSDILDWKTRYQIALGTAKGLAYLHEKCRECIIHCDIKPENILLDAAFCPKVADFGMAKLVGRDFSRVLTSMRGTIGYLAPEWLHGVAITAKADVYSYGMMIFELVSGNRNTMQSKISEAGYFPVWAAGKIKEGDVLCLLDHRLEGITDMEELNRACRVACWCIQENEESRPSMGQVVQILEGVLEVSMPPIPRFLQNLVDNEETITSYTVSRTRLPDHTDGLVIQLS